MDIELETYVNQTMDRQQYRSGIFSSFLERYARAVAYYRAPVDARGIPLKLATSNFEFTRLIIIYVKKNCAGLFLRRHHNYIPQN